MVITKNVSLKLFNLQLNELMNHSRIFSKIIEYFSQIGGKLCWDLATVL